MGLAAQSIERLACLCGGAVWFGLAGGGPEALVLMGAATGGLATTSATVFKNELFKKSPGSKKVVSRICRQFEKDYKALAQYSQSNADIKAMDDILPVLPELIFDYWPASSRIAECAMDIDGFPDAIAEDVLHRLSEKAETFGHLKPVALGGNAWARSHVRDIVKLLMSAAVSERAYFAKLEPHLIFQLLQCTGALQVAIDALTNDGALTLRHVLYDVKVHISEEFESAEEAAERRHREVIVEIRNNRASEVSVREAAQAVAKEFAPSEIGGDKGAEFVEEIVRLATSTKQKAREAVALELEGDTVGAYALLAELAQEDAEKAAGRWKSAGLIAFNAETVKAIDAYERAVGCNPDDAEAHNQLGQLYQRIGDLDGAVQAFEKVLNLGNQLADKTLLAVAAGNLGIMAAIRDDFGGAIQYYEQSLALHEELSSKKGMATVYANLGNVARTRGDLEGAVRYYEQSLALNKELGRKKGLAIAYGSLGGVARMRGDLEGAVRYHEQSLAIEKELGRKEGMANTYCSLGIVAGVQGDLEGAVWYYEQSLALYEELSSKKGMATVYANLGNVVQLQGDLEGANGYLEQSLLLNKELRSKEGMATAYGNLGMVAEKRGDRQTACAYWRQSYYLFSEIGAKPMIEQVGDWLREAGCRV